MEGGTSTPIAFLATISRGEAKHRIITIDSFVRNSFFSDSTYKKCDDYSRLTETVTMLDVHDV